MKKILLIAALAAASLLSTARAAAPAPQNTLRAPAYPLLTIDPYTSCWSAGDCLYDSHTTHWTGQPYPLVGALRVDGKVYRFMGLDTPTGAFDTHAGSERYLSLPAVQQSVDVQAMSTRYRFACGPVELTLTFTAPLFLDNLELLSRPVNYIGYKTRSLDGAAHTVEIYFEAAPACAVNTPDQATVARGERMDGLVLVRTGGKEQNVLQRKATRSESTGAISTSRPGMPGPRSRSATRWTCARPSPRAAGSTGGSPRRITPTSPSCTAWDAPPAPKAW